MNKRLLILKPIGKTTKCPNCGKLHEVKYADQVLADGTEVPCKLLGFVECGGESFMVALNGKELF
jgi:hypothetical protein